MNPEVELEAIGAATVGTEGVLRFKVWLKGLSPMTWRRVEVAAGTTLRELHGIIQVAMGWEGIHLFAFDMLAKKHGSHELGAWSPDVALGDLKIRAGASFGYEYDLNIPWKHEVRLELGPSLKAGADIRVAWTEAAPARPKTAAGRRNSSSGGMRSIPARPWTTWPGWPISTGSSDQGALRTEQGRRPYGVNARSARAIEDAGIVERSAVRTQGGRRAPQKRQSSRADASTMVTLSRASIVSFGALRVAPASRRGDMQVRVWLQITADDGEPGSLDEIVAWDKTAAVAENVGLSLAQGKELLTAAQRRIVEAQTTAWYPGMANDNSDKTVLAHAA